MNFRSFKDTVFVLAWSGMLLQPMARAASPAIHIQDVALQDGGVLLGQIHGDQGQPMVGAPVSIIQHGNEIARVSSDPQGAFSIQGLQGGVYQIDTLGQQGVYRLWAPHTAPPAAQRDLTLVSGDVVRGQEMGGSFANFANWVKSHPLMTGGIIAAAIVIPLAISNNDDEGSSINP